MMSLGLGRREPCVVCSQPVFLAQRLVVERRLYHRTCFRCARCNAQLSLAACYETEQDGQFCCETCPDEDTDSPIEEDEDTNKQTSDEDKTKSLQKFHDAMIAESSAFVGSVYQPAKETLSSKALSGFLSSQFEEDSDESDVVPALPKSLPPPLPSSEPPSLHQKNERSIADELKDISEVPYISEDESRVVDVLSQSSFGVSELRPSALVSEAPSVDIIKNNETISVVSDASVREADEQHLPPINHTSNIRETVNSTPLVFSDSSVSSPHDNVLDHAKKETPVYEDKDRRDVKVENVNIIDEPVFSQLATASEVKMIIDSSPSDALGSSGVNRKLDCEIAKDDQRIALDVSEKDNTPSDDNSTQAATSQSLVKMRMKLFETRNSDAETKPEARVGSVSSHKTVDRCSLELEQSSASVKEDVDVSTPQGSLHDVIMKDEESNNVSLEDTVNKFTESQNTESEVPCDEDNLELSKPPDINDVPNIEVANNDNIQINDDNTILTTEEDNANTVESSSNEHKVESTIKEEDLPTDDVKNDILEDDEEVVTGDKTVSSIKEEILDNSEVENSEPDKQVESSAETITTPPDSQLSPTSVLSPTSTKSEREDYPGDLNPFSSGDEEDVEKESPRKVSTNPFGSDTEEDEETPKAAEQIRKKSGEKPPRPPPPAILISGAKRSSQTLGPKRVIPAPASLNPFSSGEEDSDDGEQSWKPVASPRNRSAELSLSGGGFGGSLSSLSGTTSRRKKAPAPKPPAASLFASLPPAGHIHEDKDGLQDESFSSRLSSSNVSTASPQISPRTRKRRPAPPPPSASSTFMEDPPSLDTSLDSSLQISSITTTTSPPDRPQSSLSQRKKLISAEEFDNDPDMHQSEEWTEKASKEEKSRNRQSTGSDGFPTAYPNKSTSGQWKRRKGPAPAIPLLTRRIAGPPMPPAALRRELQLLEAQQRGLEKQGVRLEEIIRERCEGRGPRPSLPDPETDELVLQLFELVNEKNELFRRQAELMYIRRQQRLEEEHADLEHQIRCLMARPEVNKTDSDKAREEQLIQRLVEVVERRNQVVAGLETDRLRERREDESIRERMASHRAKRDENSSLSSMDSSANTIKEKKKEKRRWLKKDKQKKTEAPATEEDAGKNTLKKEKKHKKWFT